MNTTVRKSERGFSLIIGMAVLILLTVLGITVMQTVNADIDASASDKASQSALAIAEAGVTWAIDYLTTQYSLNNASHQTFLDIVNNVKGDLTPAAAASPEEKYVCPASGDMCLGWGTTSWVIVTHARPPAQTAFGGPAGAYIPHFDVWVGLDPADAAGNTLLLRSLGVDARGSMRMIEVAVAAGSGQTL